MTDYNVTTPNLADDLKAIRKQIRSMQQRMAMIEDWDWNPLTMRAVDGWHNYTAVHGGSWAYCAWAHDSLGIVHLRGLLANTIDTTATGKIMPDANPLPQSARPLYRKIFPVATGNYGIGRVDVLPDGTIQVAGYGPMTTYATYLSLEGITWVAGG